MALREFTDSLGRRWRVWAVRPQHLERRKPTPAAPPPGAPERRQRRELRSVVGEELRRGWLTFETGRLRRRLAPIPEGWALASDAELERLCEAAVAVPFRGRLIE
jgi:hypothetical protein